VAYKHNIKRYISFVDTASSIVQWFLISHKLTKLGDLLYGVIYVPPENSIYTVEDPFAELQAELDTLSNYGFKNIKLRRNLFDIRSFT
jgi:hypothetical protein